MNQIKLLAVDDDGDLMEVLNIIFKSNPDIVPKFECFTSADDFLKAITPDVQICIIDFYLKGINGLDLIKTVVKTNPACWFIMLSGQDNMDVVIEFMNNSYGTRYIKKGSDDPMGELLFFIKDIMKQLDIIESYFIKSFQTKKSVAKLGSGLNELKDVL